MIRHLSITGVIALTMASPVALAAPGPLDEALLVGRTADTLPPADEDYFREMDNGIALSRDEVIGRNMWLVWTGGNDRLWDMLTVDTFGAFDLLKTLSSHPSLQAQRDNRFDVLGLINEPCFEQASGPDPDHYGLWLDRRIEDCAPDPFANAEKYPGVEIGARGRNVPVGSYYGEPSGVLGLRLFPNPDFDEEAERNWDPERYYTDPDYYFDQDLVRPYRVGMSCAFCHVGPSPIAPPDDPNNPEMANLNATVGAQYFYFDRIFAWDPDHRNYMVQLIHTARPGTLDTSLVSTDYINNPRTMNAVYDLPARMKGALERGREELDGGELDNRQFQDYEKTADLPAFFNEPNISWSPRVLKDGADSVGALGALNRVYLNIGLFSEEWTRHFNPIVGGRSISPIPIATAQENSAYWQATEMQTPYMALYFLAAGRPDYLADAPGGEAFLTEDDEQITRGREIFADTCARCHSSKLPDTVDSVINDGCSGPNYIQCWNDFWELSKTVTFKEDMRDIVMADDFLEDNFLSAEWRVPVTLLQTNACSPLATNAIDENIWDNFSSDTYKSLPSVGTIKVHHPITGEEYDYDMPAGGVGYTRPPSLISLWSTAPYLLNNTVGEHIQDPSVEARMRSFEDGIEKMLWPDRRVKDPILGDKVPGLIDRTTQQSYLTVPRGFQPDFLVELMAPFRDDLPWLFNANGDIELGPIPKDTAIGLLANLNLRLDKADILERLDHDVELAKLIIRIKRDLKELPENATDEQARAVFADLVEPLLALSKCPDFVVNRGHYFGTDMAGEGQGLSDAQKHDLIAFLKTL
ncbi:MAG: c-type cytochrome [Geminicoccaceae bacterium]